VRNAPSASVTSFVIPRTVTANNLSLQPAPPRPNGAGERITEKAGASSMDGAGASRTEKAGERTTDGAGVRRNPTTTTIITTTTLVPTTIIIIITMPLAPTITIITTTTRALAGARSGVGGSNKCLVDGYVSVVIRHSFVGLYVLLINWSFSILVFCHAVLWHAVIIVLDIQVLLELEASKIRHWLLW